MDNLNSTGDNPTHVVTDNQNSGPVANGTGTAPASGQANGQAAPTDELFKGVDPNQLPPEARKHYDNMLRDYREKTEKLSAERKKYDGYDAFKEKAELYDQLAAQEEFVKMWNEHVQKANGSQGGSKDPAIAQMEKEVQEMKQKNSQREALEVVSAFQDAVDDKGEKLHPHFDKFNSIMLGTHAEHGEFSLLRAATELVPGANTQEKLANAYKQVESLYNSIFEEGRKHQAGKNLSKFRNSTEAPTISTDKGVFTGDPKSLSAREARELAEKRVVVR